jgi:GNAT superfamily N-acetyltransferase
MTETLATGLAATRSAGAATVRPYRPADHNACRALWGDLTRHRVGLYGDADAAGPDPGAGFEEYLTQLNLSGMWVAEDGEGEPIGFVGLLLDGRSGAVDPVVVHSDHRRRGVGRALLGRVVEEARRRGLRHLTVSPSVRDAAALHVLHASGFDRVATVTLAYDLAGRGGATSTLDLADLAFDV